MDIDQHFTLQIEDATSLGDILPLLRDLSTGLINHSQWIKVLHRTLICNDAPEENDMSDDAHHLCKFGKWYYALENSDFKDDPCFIETGDLHIKVHDKARGLLKEKMSGKTISSEAYDDFTDTANDFRVAVQDLQFTLISKVCAVDHLTGVWNRHAISDTKKINISVSIGMSVMDNQSTYNESIKLADYALIEAKSGERGRVRAWNLN